MEMKLTLIKSWIFKVHQTIFVILMHQMLHERRDGLCETNLKNGLRLSMKKQLIIQIILNLSKTISNLNMHIFLQIDSKLSKLTQAKLKLKQLKTSKATLHHKLFWLFMIKDFSLTQLAQTYL